MHGRDSKTSESKDLWTSELNMKAFKVIYLSALDKSATDLVRKSNLRK